MASFGTILRPTSGNNAPRPVNTSGRRNQPFRYIRPMGVSTEGNTNFCTTRYVDTSGNEVWHRNHGATVRGVVIDNDGNTYEVGDEYKGITLRKRNSSGAQLWSRKHGGNLNCCALCSDGIVVGGAAGTNGYTVRKYDVDGDLQWSLTTAAPVIEIAADSANNVAALDGPTLVWERTVYAISSTGTLLRSVVHGFHDVGDDYFWPSSIAFGITYSNSGVFADLFSLFLNRTTAGSTLNFGYTWDRSGGYPDGDTGQIPFHSLSGDPDDFPPAYGASVKSTLRGLTETLGYARTTPNGAYVITNSPDDFSDPLPGGGPGMCSRPGKIWVANLALRQYSAIDPEPVFLPAPYWPSTADWALAHGAQILSCDANTSGISVLGGALATP